MALVSGPSMSSFAELNPSPFSELSNLCPAEDSDDEYVYVSSLAEEIAHALMLDDDDDDEEPPSLSQPSPQELRCRQGFAWPSTSLLIDDKELVSKNAEVTFPVSHFAAAWRDHGPSEWDCFYTPSLQQASKQLSTLYTSHLEHGFSTKNCHLFRGWNSAHLAHNKREAACSRETWDVRPQEIHKTSYNAASPVRKESAGTGVFLPKIVNSGSHYRRKTGFSSSKSAYAPRHKC